MNLFSQAPDLPTNRGPFFISLSRLRTTLARQKQRLSKNPAMTNE
jgi:hypothetical protein